MEQGYAGVIAECITALGSAMIGWHRQMFN